MKFRRRQRKRARAGVDLTPMIDVVFQLLLFFMLSSTFIVQSSIQIQMPEARGASELEQKDLSVTLAYGDGGPEGAGRVYVDDDEMPTLEALTRRLIDEVQRHPNLQLLVRSDTRADTGRLVEVLGIANSVGIKKLRIGAQPAEGKP